jgi:hypothetical protein
MALFGKLVKYVVAKGMKLLPNFIGRTSAQAQADVVSEGFVLGNVITTVSGEPTELANDGKVVGQTPAVTTAADYETPVDLTIRQFTFTPFGVFGFSPFGVFGFSPFNVFGFSPFNVFGFSPFRVFGFSPTYFGGTISCIDQETPVLTKEGYALAKDIVVGDILITKTFKDIPMTANDNLRTWSSENNKEYVTQESTVKIAQESEEFTTVLINGDKYKRFSTTEEFLVVRDSKLIFVTSSELKSKDLIVKNADENVVDGLFYEVRFIEVIEEVRKVYQYKVEPFGLIIADSLLINNSYPIA